MKTPLGTEVELGPGHIVFNGDSAPTRKGHSSPPLFDPCLLWQQSPISATAELLYKRSLKNRRNDQMYAPAKAKKKDVARKRLRTRLMFSPVIDGISRGESQVLDSAPVLGRPFVNRRPMLSDRFK